MSESAQFSFALKITGELLPVWANFIQFSGEIADLKKIQSFRDSARVRPI
jgi:hypothetical protein